MGRRLPFLKLLFLRVSQKFICMQHATYEVKLFEEVFYCTLTFQFKLFMLSLMHSSLNSLSLQYQRVVLIVKYITTILSLRINITAIYYNE